MNQEGRYGKNLITFVIIITVNIIIIISPMTMTCIMVILVNHRQCRDVFVMVCSIILTLYNNIKVSSQIKLAAPHTIAATTNRIEELG